MFAVTVVATPDVVAVKVAMEAPAPIETELGTCAAALSELRETVTPPAGA
jgi:hypothetical protein